MTHSEDIILKSKNYRDSFRKITLPFLAEDRYYCHPRIYSPTIGVRIDGSEIKNMDTGHVYKQHDNRSGYKTVTLTYEGKRHQHMVHRLVLESVLYLHNCEFYEVNHIDGNKNNNHISNLEWLTRPENLKHSLDNLLKRKQYGTSNGNTKFTSKDIEDIRELYILGFRINDIVKAYNISYNSTVGIIKGVRRKNG